MNWWEQLDKKRGSRPRCVLLMDGDPKEVAERLTKKVLQCPGVTLSPGDRWKPYGKDDVTEVMLDKPNCLVQPKIQEQLRDWWLQYPAKNTPNWDIASTCSIEGKTGLLLVEAKAHATELHENDKSGSCKNREQISQALDGVANKLKCVTGSPWNLSLDHHYQLSNRFAWSWKLASLGIPVVLVYLGFLNASDMTKDRPRPIFQHENDWKYALKDYSEGVIDQTCWGKRLDISGTPLIPLIRSFDFDQPLPWMAERPD